MCALYLEATEVDVERQIVVSLAINQSMDEVLAHDLQPHHFLQRRTGDLSPEPLPGEVYGWMLSHQRRFRSVPSMDLLRMRWPAFEVVVATDGIGPLLDQMLRLVNRRLLIQSIRHLSELADDQSRLLDAPDHVFAAARDLARAVPSTGVTKFSDALNFLALYRQKELTGETPGISPRHAVARRSHVRHPSP